MNFDALKRYVDHIPTLGVPGCDLVVYKDHEPIFRHGAGFRDFAEKEPIRGDELYWLYSCTKVVTTCVAMQLIEQGKMTLDDPVSMWLPAYEKLTVKDGESVRPAKRPMTVRHLMSMQSGLSYNLERESVKRVLEATKGNATTLEIVSALAEDPLEFDPGEDFLYSLSHDVLAAVIEAVSGQRFSDYLKEHIFTPLGITGFDFTLRPEYMDRYCAAYAMDNGRRVQCPPDGNNYILSRNYESGGAGLLGNVDSYITFIDAIACGGKGKDGQHILSPRTIQLWNANQLGPKARASFDGWHRVGCSYGLGVRTRVDNTVGGKGPVGEFGWDGAAGSWVMIDCANRVSAFYAMHVRNFGYSYDVIHPTLRHLIYEGLEKD